MPFQTTVLADIKSGVVGELAFDGPVRALSAMIDTGAGAANNVVGRVFTWIDKAANTVQAGGPVADFAGILVHPKSYSSLGTTVGGTLADTLTLPDGAAGEFLFMGEIYIALVTAGGVINAPLKYNTTTGIIDIGTVGAGEALVPNAVLSRHNASPTAAGAYLAVAKLTN